MRRFFPKTNVISPSDGCGGPEVVDLESVGGAQEFLVSGSSAEQPASVPEGQQGRQSDELLDLWLTSVQQVIDGVGTLHAEQKLADADFQSLIQRLWGVGAELNKRDHWISAWTPSAGFGFPLFFDVQLACDPENDVALQFVMQTPAWWDDKGIVDCVEDFRTRLPDMLNIAAEVARRMPCVCHL